MTDFYCYTAGPLSGDPGEYLANVAWLSSVSRGLMCYGFIPINPAGDMLEGLASEYPLEVRDYQRRSLALLRLLEGRNGCLYVTRLCHRDGRESIGVRAEIEEATRLGIPIAYSLREVERLAEGKT